MRFRVLALLLVLTVGVFGWWFHRAVAPHSGASVETQETAQSSQAPLANSIQPRKPVVTFKKAIGDDYAVRPTVFQQHHKLENPPGDDASPMDRYRDLKLGKPVSVNGRNQMVLGARAVPSNLYSPSFGPVLFKKAGYSIVALDTEADASWQDMVMRDSDRPLVVNPSNGRLGVVTGTLMIKFSDLHFADRIAGAEDLRLLALDESIGVGYFRAPENYELLHASERMRKYPEVLRVELEIVDAIKGAW